MWEYLDVISIFFFVEFFFREVFFVDEPVLMVPKLYVTLPTCLLRVVDNDSGEELTRVFQKVAPNNLKKNKVTYCVNYFIQRERESSLAPQREFLAQWKSVRDRNLKLSGSTLHGGSEFSLCPTLSRRRKKTSLCKVVIVL